MMLLNPHRFAAAGGSFIRPVRVGTGNAGVNTNGSTTLALPAGSAAGDLALLVSMCNSSGTPTTPAGWNLVGASHAAASVVSRLHARVLTAGEATVELSATTRCAWLCVVIQAGTYDPTTPVESVVSTIASGTSATPGVPTSTETYASRAYLQLQLAGYDYTATPSGTTYPFAYGTWRAGGVSSFTNLIISLGDFDGDGAAPSSSFILPHSDGWQSRKYLIRGAG